MKYCQWFLCMFASSFIFNSAFPQIRESDSLQFKYQVHINKAKGSIRVDGVLDDADWENAGQAKDFWMSFPFDGEKVPAEIQTEVKVTYDDNFIYIGAKCHQPNPLIIPTLKRDNRIFWRGDVFMVVIDPVNTSTNGFSFATNPAGVQYESLISGRTGTRAEVATRTSSGGINSAWDNKWFVETSTEENIWYAEMAIPFKTLRFDPDKTAWGINFTRGEPNSTAWHTWSPTPVQFLTMDLGYTGALVWDQSPKKIKSNISVIPYTLGSYVQDFSDGEAAELGGRIGGDAKIAITPTLNLDLTLNPDFSQVDVDEQVTNLTTFNIRFPERRLFFLENSDLFSNFGIPPMRPFFSRRIGLDEDGKTIPIQYGARLSGNLNEDLRIGLMNLQTREQDAFPSQNYTAISLHQRVFQRSTVKAYFNNRQAMMGGETNVEDFNRNAGLELNYFSQDAKWQGFAGYGFSQTDSLEGDNYFYHIGGGYDGKRWSFYTNVAGIGNNYYADMGWIPTADHYDAVREETFHVGYHHMFSRLTHTFFPKSMEKVNNHQFTLMHIMDADSSVDLFRNTLRASYIVSLANASMVNFTFAHEDIRLLFPFTFTGDEPLPVGTYNFDYANLTFSSDSRKDFGWVGSLQYGSFYNGTRLQASTTLRYRTQPWGNYGLTFVYNNIQFPDPYGKANLFLIGPKIEINFSRNIFWTTFLQYNTQRDNFNINSRLQWRFQPMSDLFLVYSDDYAVEMGTKNFRALVLKLNYWLNL